MRVNINYLCYTIKENADEYNGYIVQKKYSFYGIFSYTECCLDGLYFSWELEILGRKQWHRKEV